MKLGNTSFNPDQFALVTKEQFVEQYKGKLDYDVHLAYDIIQKAIEVKEVVKETFCEAVKDAQTPNNRKQSKRAKN